MSLATSYRFELNTTRNSLQKAIGRQRDRVAEEEQQADRERRLKLDQDVTLKADWNEKLEEVADKKRLAENLNRTKEEVRLGAKAALAIRKEALRQQLRNEREQYKTELNSSGKTFYFQRL